MTIEIVNPGLLTTLQDAGRPGYAHLGVGRSGAFDDPALRIANALCGNPPNACALEITLLGPTLQFHTDAWIAVTGAPLPISIDGADTPTWAPIPIRAGTIVRLGAMRSGCRSYLAVRGGFDVEPVLGSRSSDVNAGLGPFDGRPLRRGDTLPTAGAGNFRVSHTSSTPNWRIDPRAWFDEAERPLRLVPGPYIEHLTELSSKSLFSREYKVATDSNRVGLRLTGPKLEMEAAIEMISEGCVPGLLQLPPSGQPIAFGPECPVSGGYPRIGTIAAVDLAHLAQRRPGDAVRFVACSLDDALDALRKREKALAKLETSIRTRLGMDSRFQRDEDAAAPE